MSTSTLPPPGASSKVGGGGLNTKFFGLPAWGWVAIAAAGGIGVYVWLQSRKKADSTVESGNPDSINGPAQGGYQSDVNQDLLAQIRDLQGSNSTPTDGGDDTPTTPALKPAPTNLKFAVLTTKTATLTWTGVPDIVQYRVTWQKPNGTINNVPFGTMNTTGLNAKKGDTISARVVGIDDKSNTLTQPAVITQQIK